MTTNRPFVLLGRCAAPGRKQHIYGPSKHNGRMHTLYHYHICGGYHRIRETSAQGNVEWESCKDLEEHSTQGGLRREERKGGKGLSKVRAHEWTDDVDYILIVTCSSMSLRQGLYTGEEAGNIQ